MRTSKYFLLTAAFILLASLGTATAQKMPPEPIMPVIHINAIEVTDGVVGIDQLTKLETVFGYSFLGRTTGSYPGSFTLSMNCSPAIPVAGDTSLMTGGSWTLPVYTSSFRGGATYAGSLYGTIAEGKMIWDKANKITGGENAAVFFVLNVEGGTQTWDGAKGYATFAGTLFVDEKTKKTTLTGDLVFTMFTGQQDY